MMRVSCSADDWLCVFCPSCFTHSHRGPTGTQIT